MKKHILALTVLAISTLTACAQTSTNDRLISQDDFINAAESTVNGVVSVKSYATPRASIQRGGFDPFNDPFFQYFFGTPGQRQQAPAEQQQVGLGSGVIISEDGLIVTNYHVINGAERLEVTLNDNRNFPATIVGYDDATDLALIKIEAPDLHVIPMGDSDQLHVGEWVLAVGNPFGFTSSVTSGIVSAKARNISSSTQSRGNGGIESYIQTDAAVNSGNSGGALVNLQGELVGINTAIYSQTGSYIGCSFAIPTSIVKKVVADLQEFGTVQRAFLGISFIELTPEVIAEKGIEGVTRGIYVAEVQDHSAAIKAGIQPGDIILTIDDTNVNTTADLQEIMTRHSPGDVVEINLIRDSNAMSVKATLRNREGNTNVTTAETPMGVLGATFETAEPEILRSLEINRGVQVTITGSGRFSQAGIRDGFIITSINSMRISSPDDVEKIFSAIRALNSGEDKVMFISGIYPTGKRAHYAVDLSE